MEELRKKFLSLTNSSIYVYSLLGLILIGFGVLAYKIDIFSSGDVVEVLNSTNAGPEDSQDIVVEISGSVEKPGVYSFKEGSRVDDLLIAAGGLSENADRDWVIKNINSTKEVKGLSNVTEANPSGFININTSSQSELEKLVGIGPVYAQNIIEHRPYSMIEDLIKNGVIPAKTFEKIKTQIAVN